MNLGLNMEEFGKKLTPPANKSLVSKWEKGKNLPNNERIKQISEIGDVTPYYLLNGNKPFGDPYSPFELNEVKELEKWMTEKAKKNTQESLEELANYIKKNKKWELYKQIENLFSYELDITSLELILSIIELSIDNKHKYSLNKDIIKHLNSITKTSLRFTESEGVKYHTLKHELYNEIQAFLDFINS